LQQAEICCEQARLAVRQKRLLAGCGLLSTAIALYQHVLRNEGTEMSEKFKTEVQEQIAHLQQEMTLCQELRKSHARPLAA
jgi:type II secretory pathway component PulM